MKFAGNLKPADVARLLGRPVDHVVPYKKGAVIAANVGRPYVLGASRFFGFGRAIARIINEVSETSPASRNGRAPAEANGVAVEDDRGKEVSP
jgi:hypothetical protein